MDYEKKYKEALERAKSFKTPELRDVAEYIFPELKESEDERIRKELIEKVKETPACIGFNDKNAVLAWLEKQGEQPSAIRWYDVSLIPQEMEELLVEWDSEDATWHEIAFYHADTKTFWNGTRQVENVTRWCYIIDLLEKQGEQEPAWSEEDEKMLNSIIDDFYDGKTSNMLQESWLKSLKQRIKGE